MISLFCILEGCTSSKNEPQYIELNTLNFDEFKLKSTFTNDYKGTKEYDDDTITILITNKKTLEETDRYVFYKTKQLRLEHTHIQKDGFITIIRNSTISFKYEKEKILFSKLIHFDSSIQSNTNVIWSSPDYSSYSTSGKFPSQDLRIDYAGDVLITDRSYISKYKTELLNDSWILDPDKSMHKYITGTLVYKIEG